MQRLKNVARSAAGYGGAFGLCLLIYVLLTRLWRLDWSVPLALHTDGLVIDVYIKGIIENGWYLHNPRLGIPGGFDMRDYPLSDNFFFLILKLMSCFTSDYAVILNLFYTLSYPVTAVTALFVLRRFGCSYLPSLAAAVLYALLPYHFLRGPGHLFLACYFTVPLMVLTALWLYLGYPCLFHAAGEADRARFRPFTSETVAAVLICVLAASAGVYYACFGAFLLFVAGASASLSRRRLYPLAAAGVLVAVVIGAVVVNVLPSLIHMAEQGPNPDVVGRLPSEAETFGMKIIQLLLPISGHRVPWLASLSDHYNSGFTPLLSENCLASLGAVGSFGFLFLIGRLLYRRRAGRGRELLDGLTILNLFCVLLATIGGFGALLAYYVYPMIRAYNRISIYIAFLALFAVVLLLDRVRRRYVHTPRGRALFAAVVVLLLAVGVLDQTSAGYVPHYQRARKEYRIRQDFFARVEAAVPPGSRIFQLPYHSFPEAGAAHRMQDYDHFRGYLHTRTLCWSYGSMRGRPGDLWQRRLAARSMDELVEALAHAGFAGIYLDRFAFLDNGAYVESELTRLVAGAPLVSNDQRYVFYDLMPQREALRQACTPEEWERRERQVWQPILVRWGGGFHHGPEGVWQGCHANQRKPDEVNNWLWCRRDGTLTLINSSDAPKQVELQMQLATGRLESSHLWIESGLFSACLEVSIKGTPLRQTVMVPPGTHTVRFSSDATPVDPRADPRELVFRVEDFSIREIEE